MTYKYTVKISYSFLDTMIMDEFDNPDDALDLHDKIAKKIDEDDAFKFDGTEWDCVRVCVERAD